MTACAQSSDTMLESLVDSYLAFLSAKGALPTPLPPTPWASFHALRSLVRRTFDVPWTTYSAAMEHMIFGIACAFRPRSVIGVGTFVGYTFAWQLRDRRDTASGPHVRMALGIDTDARANVVARKNCARLGHGERLRFIDGDGVDVINSIAGEIDVLYLDLDSPQSGKGEYLDVLISALPRLSDVALVLAHDSLVPKFEADMAVYHDFIAESGDLLGPWILPIDECGLSVALKVGSQ